MQMYVRVNIVYMFKYRFLLVLFASLKHFGSLNAIGTSWLDIGWLIIYKS